MSMKKYSLAVQCVDFSTVDQSTIERLNKIVGWGPITEGSNH